MIAGDRSRAIIALGFIAAFSLHRQIWFALLIEDALLMVASPFFTSGRSAILPSIATPEGLHGRCSGQPVRITLAVGALFFGGTTAAKFGYEMAFLFSARFLFRLLHLQLRSSEGSRFRARRIPTNL